MYKEKAIEAITEWFNANYKINVDYSTMTINIMEKNVKNRASEEAREKALNLVNAYFDGKEIEVCDPLRGIPSWVSIDYMSIWTFLEIFCKNTEKYRIKD